MSGPTDEPTGVRAAMNSIRRNPPIAPGPSVSVASGSSLSAATRKLVPSRTSLSSLVLAYAAKAGVPALTSGVVRPILGAASTAGYGREDFSALGKVVRALAGIA